jgi:hypothetical protein
LFFIWRKIFCMWKKLSTFYQVLWSIGFRSDFHVWFGFIGNLHF